MLSKHLKHVLLFVIGFIYSIGTHASDFDLSTPSQTIFTHTHYLRTESFDPVRSAKTIYGKKGKTAEDLAIKLKHYLDVKLLVIDTAIYPNINDYVDSATQKHVFFPFHGNKDIYLQRIGGKWYYSPYTVSQIEILYKEAVPFGSDFLINLFGSWGENHFLGLKVWQWMSVLMLIASIILIYRIQRWLLNILIKDILYHKKVVSQEVLKIIKSFGKYTSVYLIMHYTRLFIPSILLPAKANIFFIKGIEFTAIIFLVILLFAAIDILIVRYAKFISGKSNPLANQFKPILQILLKSFAVMIGVGLLLKTLNVNIGALLAGVSIAGLAIALAAQDTVKNVLGSIIIFLDQPFKIGDDISVDNIEGTIEIVGLRSTRVRAFDNALIYVPNNKLTDSYIKNNGLRVYRRFFTNLGIMYGTPHYLIHAFIEGIKKMILSHPSTRKDSFQVSLYNLDVSSISIRMNVFFQVPNFDGELQARQELINGIIALADMLGVQFAFPTTTIQIENQPGQPSLSPTYREQTEDIEKEVQAFISKFAAQFQNNVKSK
ncbi:MAG: mechanosensitive ion channel family protein [Bacteroidia bacterium]|nr:mechanosensitive ion channel family protein [Bacteroidia bacterium]